MVPAELIAECFDDPLLWINRAYPWVAGAGPDAWQVDVCEMVRLAVRGEAPRRIAVASGHGIGKTAMAAWLIDWFVNTRPHPQVIVTANTGAQLQGKTWRELAKWSKQSWTHELYDWKATKFYNRAHPDTWYATPVTWSKDNPEAFAGTHEDHVLVLMDEASAIPDPIWEVIEGAMTTPGAVWLAWGNPTRNTGRFRECFPGRRFAHRWQTLQVDSRTAKMADQVQIDEWITDYGEDSDFVRIRVRGVFPRAASTQFIGEDLVEAAQKRQPQGYEHAPIILGVDVARFGDDRTVILVRRGHAILEKRVFRGKDTMQVAALVAETINACGAHATMIDATGGDLGAGVYDRLVQLGYRRPDHALLAINVGVEARRSDLYVNKRAEMWSDMKAWIRDVGCLPADDRTLAADLTGIEYGFDGRERFQLESKKDLKKRGLASPDEGDALALTFAEPVAPPSWQMASQSPARQAHGVGFNPRRR